MHFHIHLIPRRSGDSVVPQGLPSLFADKTGYSKGGLESKLNSDFAKCLHG